VNWWEGCTVDEAREALKAHMDAGEITRERAAY
jgi:hypothetical protein